MISTARGHRFDVPTTPPNGENTARANALLDGGHIKLEQEHFINAGNTVRRAVQRYTHQEGGSAPRQAVHATTIVKGGRRTSRYQQTPRKSARRPSSPTVTFGGWAGALCATTRGADASGPAGGLWWGLSRPQHGDGDSGSKPQPPQPVRAVVRTRPHAGPRTRAVSLEEEGRPSPGKAFIGQASPGHGPERCAPPHVEPTRLARQEGSGGGSPAHSA